MSANREMVLPFPRGGTFGDGIVTMTSTMAADLEGRTFECDDTINGTPLKVLLRIVRNESGGALTPEKKFYRYGTAAGQFRRQIAGLCNGAGQVGKPMDEQYVDDGVTSILEHDLFYVVEEGPCAVLSEATAVALAAHAAIATDASGLVNGVAAAAGEAVLGTVDSAQTTVDTEVLIIVASDVHDSEA